MTAKEIRTEIMRAYEIDGQDQHNKNLSIMIDCFLEDGYANTYKGLKDFAAYASDNDHNLQKFIDHGAVIINK